MKHLVQLITEGDISRIERKYREFCKLCKVYDPNVDMKNICVHKTSKNNWAVYDGDKKLFIASYLVLDDDVIKNNDIKLCNESQINEAKYRYSIEFLQYDPDVLAYYENGDADEDDLHNSEQSADVKDLMLTAKSWSDAESKITKELAKIVNKYPEVCGCEVYGEDGELIDTIYV